MDPQGRQGEYYFRARNLRVGKNDGLGVVWCVGFGFGKDAVV